MTRPTDLPLELELSLIAQAREVVGVEGFTVPTAAAQDAKERLVAAYAGLISATVASVPPQYRDDAEATCYERLLTLIADHDLERGVSLSHRLKAHLADAIKSEAALRAPFSVDPRERARFYSTLLVKADGDYGKALELADADPRFSRDRFAALYRALVASESLDATPTRDDEAGGERPADSLYGTEVLSVEEEVERRELVEWLLSKLDDRERLLILLAYGFTTESLTSLRLAAGFQEDEQLSDTQLTCIPNLGVTSRRSVIRIRHAALDKMRAALDVTPAA